VFAEPQKIIEQFGLKSGMIVADLGAGTGALSFAAAAKVADGNGKVYAVEVQKELLLRLKKDAQDRHISNIEILWGNIEKSGGTKIRDRAVDAVLVSNVLFQVEDRMGFLAEVKRILKPDGRVLVVDWTDSFGGMGPSGNAVITKDAAKGLFEKNNFSAEREIDAGSHHYGIIFKKN